MHDPWRGLRQLTSARIALGRTGASLPTKAVLDFALAHAQARDAVHASLDWQALARHVAPLLGTPIDVESRATERALYLRRPDLGRVLSAASAQTIDAMPRQAWDLAIVIGDGLSASAIATQAVPLLASLAPRLSRLGLSVAPPVFARGARVALGDDIGERLGARAVTMLIGERPGLSSPDSLGAYFTFAPARGRTDAERNCISNIRGEGLSHELAAFKLSWLVREALRRGVSGVALKDESDTLLHGGSAAPPMLTL